MIDLIAFQRTIGLPTAFDRYTCICQSFSQNYYALMNLDALGLYCSIQLLLKWLMIFWLG